MDLDVMPAREEGLIAATADCSPSARGHIELRPSAEVVGTIAGGPANTEMEEVGGFKVHPLASLFPLIVGKDFDDLVEAAARAAVQLLVARDPRRCGRPCQCCMQP